MPSSTAALVQGYALDALEVTGADASGRTRAPRPRDGFTLLVTDCTPDHRARGVGLGESLSFADQGVCGTALAHDGELIQLTAFPQDPERSERERVIRTGRVRQAVAAQAVGLGLLEPLVATSRR